MIDALSPVTQLGIRTATPLAILVGVYLLFAGHNNPGGGFAAGLVFGAVVSLRVVSGLQRPTHAHTLIAGGLIVIVAVALAPVLWGDSMLDQLVISREVPLLGKVKSGSALPFDIGVTAVVIGLVVAVLDGLGAADLAKAAGSAGEHNSGGDA